MVCKSDQRLQNAAETHISGIFTPQNEEGKGGWGEKDKTPKCVLLSEFIWTVFGKSLSIWRRVSARRVIPA